MYCIYILFVDEPILRMSRINFQFQWIELQLSHCWCVIFAQCFLHLCQYSIHNITGNLTPLHVQYRLVWLLHLFLSFSKHGQCLMSQPNGSEKFCTRFLSVSCSLFFSTLPQLNVEQTTHAITSNASVKYTMKFLFSSSTDFMLSCNSIV